MPHVAHRVRQAVVSVELGLPIILEPSMCGRGMKQLNKWNGNAEFRSRFYLVVFATERNAKFY